MRLPPYKTCSCGKTFDLAAWSDLPLVGYQLGEGPYGDPAALVLRNCGACGSTLTVLAIDEVEAKILDVHVGTIADRIQRSAAQTRIAILEVRLGMAQREVGNLKRRIAERGR
jgi:hypothetical protein